MTNGEFVSMLRTTLSKYEYHNSTSLVATSLCCDEVNQPLIETLEKEWGSQSFSFGGLAGFAFGGVTSFGAMASHIPDGGSCLVVFGPHVGIDSTGTIGTVERRGRKSGGACCGSATAAANFVAQQQQQQKQKQDDHANTMTTTSMMDPVDAQQQFVNNLLLPHGERLEQANNKSSELPMALFDAQQELIQRIVAKGCSKVADGNIAVVGGIQINTPEGMSDYFLPLQFELRNNQGVLIKDFLHENQVRL